MLSSHSSGTTRALITSIKIRDGRILTPPPPHKQILGKPKIIKNVAVRNKIIETEDHLRQGKGFIVIFINEEGKPLKKEISNHINVHLN